MKTNILLATLGMLVLALAVLFLFPPWIAPQLDGEMQHLGLHFYSFGKKPVYVYGGELPRRYGQMVGGEVVNVAKPRIDVKRFVLAGLIVATSIVLTILTLLIILIQRIVTYYRLKKMAKCSKDPGVCGNGIGT